MGIACFQIAAKIYRKERFRFGEARILSNSKPSVKPASSKPKKAINKKPLFRH
jgi:hypothetical protein